MNGWILPTIALSKAAKEQCEVDTVQELDQRIDGPCDPVVEVRSCEMTEESAQEWICCEETEGRIFARESNEASVWAAAGRK